LRAGHSRMTCPAAAGAIRCNPRVRRHVGGIRLHDRLGEAVDRIGSHALPIATVIDVVAAAVVEVDAPEETHIARR